MPPLAIVTTATVSNTITIPLESQATILEMEIAVVRSTTRSNDPRLALASNARLIKLQDELDTLRDAIAAA